MERFGLLTAFVISSSGNDSGFAPEKEFLDKIKAIDGVSLVETQTITNMEI